MGYDAHITRKENWSDEEGSQITLKEWLAYVATDSEVKRDPQNGEEDFLCTTGGAEPWPLWWSEGEVYTKNPDQNAIRKMIEIAQKLGARVQGDDGETYSDWKRFPQSDEDQAAPKPKGFFRRLFGP